MAVSDPSAEPSVRTWRRGKVALVATAAAAVAGLLFAYGRALLPTVAEPVVELSQWVEGSGWRGALAFVAVYAVAVAALVPGSLLTAAAGAVFGLARGTALVFAGATLGAALGFLVARYVARGAVERRLAGNPRFAAVDRAIGREGRKIVFLLRLSPVVPFSIANYALGLTRVRFVDYLVASVGMLPGTLLYVYYGKVIGDVATIAAGAAPERGPEYWLALGLGLAATVAATALVTRTARRALASEVADAPR